MIRERLGEFVQIYSNENFDVYYDVDRKKYYIDTFEDNGCFWRGIRFDPYEKYLERKANESN